MTKVTRYKMYTDMDACCVCEMDERDDGSYVTYEDYAAVEAERDALRAAVDACAVDAEPYHTATVTYCGPAGSPATWGSKKRIAVDPDKWAALLAAREAT